LSTEKRASGDISHEIIRTGITIIKYRKCFIVLFFWLQLNNFKLHAIFMQRQPNMKNVALP
jgi:hypothetical protein